MNKRLWVFVLLAFVVGICLGVIYGEKKVRYAVAGSGNAGVCWVIDTQTGHLYWRSINKTIDLGKSDSTLYEEIRLEKFDLEEETRKLLSDTSVQPSKIKSDKATSNTPPEQ